MPLFYISYSGLLLQHSQLAPQLTRQPFPLPQQEWLVSWLLHHPQVVMPVRTGTCLMSNQSPPRPSVFSSSLASTPILNVTSIYGLQLERALSWVTTTQLLGPSCSVRLRYVVQMLFIYMMCVCVVFTHCTHIMWSYIRRLVLVLNTLKHDPLLSSLDSSHPTGRAQSFIP